jgi:peptidoglycan/xylan/chitin deacetylase (PgdA/CDA1 family)
MYIKKESFCTWQEIKEMAQSGLVKIASHSLSHQDLTIEGTDLEDEVLGSKKIIQQRLSQEVDTFIYPYGRVNRKVHSVAKRYYKYLMRIGSALNKDWHNSNNMIYRVNGDHLINKKSLNRVALFKYYLKYLLNTIRGK